jgi:hypothetical protein
MHLQEDNHLHSFLHYHAYPSIYTIHCTFTFIIKHMHMYVHQHIIIQKTKNNTQCCIGLSPLLYYIASMSITCYISRNNGGHLHSLIFILIGWHNIFQGHHVPWCEVLYYLPHGGSYPPQDRVPLSSHPDASTYIVVIHGMPPAL